MCCLIRKVEFSLKVFNRTELNLKSGHERIYLRRLAQQWMSVNICVCGVWVGCEKRFETTSVSKTLMKKYKLRKKHKNSNQSEKT